MTPEEEEAVALKARRERAEKVRAMTMQEFLSRRERLIRELYKAISDFEWDTCACVKQINLVRSDDFGGDRQLVDVLLVTEVP